MPAWAGTLLALPLAVLEWVSQRGCGEGYPVARLGFLWLVPAAFVLILAPVAQEVRAGAGFRQHPARFLVCRALLVLILFVQY